MATAICLPAANSYLVHNLVSDLPNIADHQDKNLVNPWGNGFSGASPFWVGNNHTGTSTLYDGTGTPIALVVQVPAGGGKTTPGPVTGVIANGNANAFQLTAGRQANFIFCTEDGTISGWNTNVDATHAKIMVDNSATGAVYKGCAVGGTTAAPLLYAANFSSGKIDVFDGSFKPVSNPGFTNTGAQAGLAPFNVAVLNGKVYVSFAKPDAAKEDDVPGVGNGYVGVYDFSGNLLTILISGGALNSPWGMAIAPSTFGDFGGALLVGNFGDGLIHAYNLTSGAPMGALNDTSGNPIKIQGLWSLNFGNDGRGGNSGTLYFTAGIGGGPNNDPVESHGLLGSIQAAPSFTSANVVNAASLGAPIAPNTWVSILKGAGLSATTRGWATADFSGTKLPTQLDKVGVTVNGEAASVSFISPGQINILVPTDIQPGRAQIQVTNNGLTSANVSVTVLSTAPAFFAIGAPEASTGNLFIAAEHADGSLAGPPNLITGATSTPFKSGETMVLFATGLGATNPAAPNGTLPSGLLPLSATPTVTVGGQPARVTFAGLVGPGLYQLNVVVPSGLAAGSTPVVITTEDGAQSQAKAVVAIM